MTELLVCPDTALFLWFWDFFNHSQSVLENIERLARVDWINKGSFHWNDEFDVPLAKIVTRRGMGFTFNSLRDEELFQLQK